MAIDLDKLFEDAKDPEKALALEALNGKAVATLMEALMASSEDVRRKAAVDILNFNKQTKTNAPTVTLEQLEYLGRVIVEAEAIRLSNLGGESGPRVAEGLGTN